MKSRRLRTLALGVLVLGMFALVVSACGGSGSSEPTSESTEAGTETTSEAAGKSGDGGAEAGMGVGYMTASPINQGSWDPTLWKAFKPIADREGWSVDLAESVPGAQAEQVLTQFGEKGDGLVLVTSQEYEPAMLEAAEEFPETKFVMLTDLASTNELPNVGAYAIDWFELGYLGGAAGAIVSANGNIGLIGGQPITPCLKAFAAAEAGAKKVNPEATTSVQYIGDWVDPAKGGQTAAAVLNSGADVTFSIAGGTVPGIMQSVSAAGAFAIGTYTDESHYAPGHVPTSVVIEWEPSLEELAKEMSSGSFKAEIIPVSIAREGLNVLPFKDVPGAAAKTKEMEGLISQIKAGEIKVPTKELSAS